MIKLGLTGGIATGKSTVSAYIRELGIPVIDADVTAREIVEPGEPAYDDIVSYFGPEILQADGTLNRAALGKIVFSYAEKLAKLNEFTHPRVFQRTQEKTATLVATGADVIVYDIPLLFEANRPDSFDAIMVVTIPRTLQIQRLMARNHFDEQEAVKRIEAQMPMAEKEARADYVIYNDGDLQTTYRQVDQIIADVKKKLE